MVWSSLEKTVGRAPADSGAWGSRTRKRAFLRPFSGVCPFIATLTPIDSVRGQRAEARLRLFQIAKHRIAEHPSQPPGLVARVRSVLDPGAARLARRSGWATGSGRSSIWSNEREDGRVCADAECEREHGDNGDEGRLEECAERESEVVHGQRRARSCDLKALLSPNAERSRRMLGSRVIVALVGGLAVDVPRPKPDRFEVRRRCPRDRSLQPRRSPTSQRASGSTARLASLSLRERVGQMVMVWVLGDYTQRARLELRRGDSLGGARITSVACRCRWARRSKLRPS